MQTDRHLDRKKESRLKERQPDKHSERKKVWLKERQTDTLRQKERKKVRLKKDRQT
jgi:hypothetical protein